MLTTSQLFNERQSMFKTLPVTHSPEKKESISQLSLYSSQRRLDEYLKTSQFGPHATYGLSSTLSEQLLSEKRK